MRAFERVTVVASVLVAGVAVGLEIERARAARQPEQLPPIPRDPKEVGLTPTPIVPAPSVRLARRFDVSRRKKFVIAIAALAALAIISAGAVAAIIIYTGANGSVSGKIESGTISKALTVTAKGTVPTALKGTTTPVPVTIKNNDTAAAHTTATWSVTFTTTPTASCASHLSYNGGLMTGTNIPAGGSVDQEIQVTVAPTLPDTCAGADWVATVNGTTNP